MEGVKVQMDATLFCVEMKLFGASFLILLRQTIAEKLRDINGWKFEIV